MKVTNVWVISRGRLFESCVWTCGQNTFNAPVRCNAPRFFQTFVTTSQHGVTSHKTWIYCNTAREDIQGDPKVDILGGDKMVNVRKKILWTRVKFPIVTEIELSEPADHTPLDFCLCGWMNSEVYKRKVDKRKVDTRNELLTSILHSATRITKLRRRTRDLRTRLACKMHWRWMWDFRTFIESRKRCHFCVTNMSFTH